MKKTVLFLFLLGISTLIWYLFIKQYDYQFTFITAYGPGSVYEEIINLDQLDPDANISAIKTIEKEPYNGILQHYALSPVDTVALLWEMKAKTDSTSTVTVYSKKLKNQLQNRLAIINPFSRNSYINELEQDLKNLGNHLRAFQQNYRVLRRGIQQSPEAHCACVSSTTTAQSKASAMKVNIDLLENFVAINKLHQVGYPMVQLTHWDKQTDSIRFDFCFPLDKMPKNTSENEVFLKRIEAKEALSAEYNGNYALSHRAWYDLYEQARKEDLSTDGLPIEVFKSNPKNGGAPITWEAEIYLPIRIYQDKAVQ